MDPSCTAWRRTAPIAFLLLAFLLTPVTARATGDAPDFVLSAKALRATGYTELHRALAELVPALHAPMFAATDGSDHAARIQASGHTSDQLVVLVNGRRRHKSALLNLADAPGRGSVGTSLTTIAPGAIDRIEVHLGSAIARHGGDALSAVINVILKGAPAEQSAGSLSVQYGLNSGELQGVPELLSVNSTATSDIILEFSGDRNVDDGDGESAWLTGDWGFQVGTDGFLRLAGEYRKQDPTNRAGFDPRQQYPLAADGSFDLREATIDRLNNRTGIGASTRINVGLHTELALPLDYRFYGELSISTNETDTFAEFRRPLDARNVTAVYPDGFLPQITTDTDDRGFVFGVRGDAFGWAFDIGWNIGDDEVDFEVSDSLNASMGALSPTRFSTGNNESGEKSFVIAGSRELAWRKPVAVEFQLGAGSESYEIEQADAASILAGGARNSDGLLAEPGVQGFDAFRTIELDISRDVLFAYGAGAWKPNAASNARLGVRLTDYSDLGVLLNAQLSADYALAGGTLTASAALGEHAPSLVQSTYTRTAARFDALDDAQEVGLYRPIDPIAAVLGGQALKAERITRLELGFARELLPGWHLDINAYHSRVNDQVVLSDVLSGSTIAAVLAGAGHAGVTEASYFFNGPRVRNTGLNFATNYRFELNSLGALDVQLAANLNDTKVSRDANSTVLEALGSDRFGSVARRRLSRGLPDRKITASAHWQRDRFDALVRAVHYGSVVDPLAAERIAPATLLSLVLSYAATPSSRLSLGVHNGLDEYPDAASTEPGTPVDNRITPYSRYSPYGTDGRFVFLRLTTDFN